MQIESKKRWIFLIDGFSNRTSYKLQEWRKQKHLFQYTKHKMKKHYFDKAKMKYKIKNMMLSYKKMIPIEKTIKMLKNKQQK